MGRVKKFCDERVCRGVPLLVGAVGTNLKPLK